MDKQRIITGAAFFLILAVFLIVSIWFPLASIIYFLVVAIMGSLELAHALRKRFTPLSYISIVIGSLTMLAPLYIWRTYQSLASWHILTSEELPLAEDAISNFIWLLAFGLLFFLLLYVIYAFLNVIIKIIRFGPDTVPHAVAESSAAFYIALPLSCVVLFQYAVPNGWYWLVYALVLPMVIDVSAYYFGSMFGKKKMLPSISPNKSWIGFFSGIAVAMLVSVLYFASVFSGEFPLITIGKAMAFGLLSGLVIGVVAQFGDWLMSALKRWCGIKDFSKLLPGHGGVLDRFDSIFYSLPATLILSICFYLIKRGA